MPIYCNDWRPSSEDVTIYTYILYVEILFIPIIVISNILIVISLKLAVQLNSPHNYIFFSIALLDILTGLVALPMEAASIATSERVIKFRCHEICVIRLAVELLLDDLNFSFLVYLVLDRLLMLGMPRLYKRFCTIKFTKEVLTAITFITLVFYSTFIVVRYNEGGYTCFYLDELPVWFRLFVASTFSFRLSMSIFISLYIFIRYGRATYDAVALQTVCILTWMPTVVLVFRFQYLSKASKELLVIIARLISYLTPLTTSAIVAWTKPEFRKYLVFLLTNPPNKWKHIRNIDALETMMAEARVRRTLATLRDNDLSSGTSATFTSFESLDHLQQKLELVKERRSMAEFENDRDSGNSPDLRLTVSQEKSTTKVTSVRLLVRLVASKESSHTGNVST